MTQARFKKGDFVRRKSNPDLAGKVQSAERDSQTNTWTYKIRFGSGVRGVSEEDLDFVPENTGGWDEVRRGSFASAASFKELMTYERLRKPPNRIANSFGSAKAAFYPYQFKPLLKFLENPDQRILIADDVGLGKTIEAGYILRELRLRHGLDRALIVVPARLTKKWKDELDRRFGEQFDVVRRRELRELTKQLESSREPRDFRWIVSYESARDSDFIEVLTTFQPPFDLVIFDEAHRMRNRETLQSQLGRALGTCADALVMLSATPMQTSLDNLFTLFQMMDPDGFADAELFAQQMNANRPVVRALNAIRFHPPRSQEMVAALESLRESPLTAPIAEGRFFETLITRAARAEELTGQDLVELQRDVSELSLTGYMLSRTRKADVLKNRPIRRAEACRVVFTSAEREFYDGVANICRSIHPDSSGWGLAMSMLTAYRYTASCIPAAIEYFRARLGKADISLADDEEVDDDAQLSSANDAVEVEINNALAQILTHNQAAIRGDTKFQTFWSALQTIWNDDLASSRQRRKIVVFSFFKRTLSYLSKRLTAQDVRHELITGDIPIYERENRIENFASNPAVEVLLSSEVGSEGLDLQFASVIVNYDLPWNPMAVEQRIGRLDRLGQRASVITILNLVVEDTIEDRILLRLFERIGLFKDTIGELDPILGSKFEQLAASALRGELTREEELRRADEAIRAVLEQNRQASHLEHHADALMAADQAFLDEISAMVGRRRTPAPEELRTFLHEFLQRRYPGSGVSPNAISDVGELWLEPAAASEIRTTLGAQADVQRLLRRLQSGRIRVTFNQDVALDHASVELLHARHPLVVFGFEETRRRHDALHRAFAITVTKESKPELSVSPAMYAFDIRLLDLNGIRPRTQIVPMFTNLETGDMVVGDQAEQLLDAMLGHGLDMPGDPRLEADHVSDLEVSFGDYSRMHRQGLLEKEIRLNEARSERRLATMQATLGNKIRKAKARLQQLQAQRSAEFAVRMAVRKVEIAEQELTQRLADLQHMETVAIEYEELASGLLWIV
jgi:SNF2 family DNA or RNA helicase